MNQQEHSQQPEPDRETGSARQAGYVGHRPSRAAFCALIPGMGAVYNGQYMKAVLHFAIFAGLIEIADEVGVFTLAAIAFYIFQMMDAYRSAVAIGEYESQHPDQREARTESELNFPLWGGALVVMGVVLLLDTLGAIRLESIATYWPIIFIVLGLYLIYAHLQKKNQVPPAGDRGAPVRSAGPVEEDQDTRPPEGTS